MIDSRRRTLPKSRFLAVAAISAVVVGSVIAPTAAVAAPGDDSASSSRFLTGSLLLGGLPLDDVVALQGVQTTNDGSTGEPNVETGGLDITALNALSLGIPGGLSVPALSNFLTLGAVNQYSVSNPDGSSRAATGAVADNGVVDTTGTGAFPANASLNRRASSARR